MIQRESIFQIVNRGQQVLRSFYVYKRVDFVAYMHTVRNPKASEKKSIWKRPLPIRLSHIFANIIGIYLQTMRSQTRLLVKEQPNTGHNVRPKWQ